jgi:hypothetical protein
MNYMTQQNSIRLSSAPGPRYPVKYSGYKMDGLCCIMPRTSWTFAPAINFASIGDNLCVSFITYTNCIKHPDEFIKIIESKFDAFCEMGVQEYQ